jgi:AcrR family transcriptional regulator
MSTQKRTSPRGKRNYELRQRARRQAQTRQRIVQATVALHEQRGPAATTVAEIARRAGVSRVTVYNHFPTDGELFAECQREFFTQKPLPDLASALSVGEPYGRVREVLAQLYGSYRRQEPMTSKVLRDRKALPALDELLARTLDARQAELTDALAAGLGVDRQAGNRARAIIALSLDFWTWLRLAREGLDDDAAAALMAELVVSAAHDAYTRPAEKNREAPSIGDHVFVPVPARQPGDDIDAVIASYHEALDAFFRGDPNPVKPLLSHGDDVTLANPFGPPRRGWRDVEDAIDRAASNYRDGAAMGFDQVSRRVTPELAYLVELEHYRAKVGESDEPTPVSLRCTTVFSREANGWKIIHRHADPITAARPAESVAQR